MWTITIKTKRDMNIADVRAALLMLGSAIEKPRTTVEEKNWGWSGYLADIMYPAGKELIIRGADSNPSGDALARAISKALRKLGYETRIGRKKPQ